MWGKKDFFGEEEATTGVCLQASIWKEQVCLYNSRQPALVASGKASPHVSSSGASWGPLGFPLPSMLGPKTLCGVGAGT